jgi:hypothetical protein
VSDGSHSDKNVHRPRQSHDPPLAPTQDMVEAIEAPNPAHFIQVLPFTSIPTHTTNLSTTNVGPRFGFRGLDVIMAG